MTTTWAVAPAGRLWRQVDPLLGVAAPLIDAEATHGGVHQVRWDPDQRARIAFDRADGGVVVLDFTATGVRRTRLADDPALSGLNLIFDPARLAGRLGGLLGAPIQKCDVELVSYRPGSRCVLRCDVLTDAGMRPLFIKVLAGGVQRYVEANLALTTLGNAHGNPLLVPPIIGAWTDIDAVVSSAVPGTTASAALADESSPLAARVALAHSVGELLAVVHQAPRDPVFSENPWTGADELSRIADYLPAAWHADPMTAPSLTWLVNALTESCPASTRQAFSHGSFRTGQVLVNPDGLTVLDLDGVGTADPARDLGNAMAYLAWRGVRRNDQSPSVIDALHDGYLAGGGTVGEDDLAWWQAAAITKIAGRRYRSLHTSHWPKLPELLRVADDLLDRTKRSELGGFGKKPANSARIRSSDGTGPRPDMVDPSHLTAVLRPLLAPHADGGARPTIRTVQTLRVARGRRVVVRCKVTGLSAKPEFIVVKDYAQTWRAGTTYENLVNFSVPLDTRSNVGVPVPLGVLPSLGIVAYREAVGLPMTDLSEEVAVRVARRAGLWLDCIHGSPMALSRRVDLARELMNVDEWADEIGLAHQSLQQPALYLAAALRSLAAELPAVAEAPIHKDFHPGHILRADNAGVTVIDLDEARMGDPAFDVAHMCVHAEEMKAPWALGIRDSFAGGYGELPGESPESRLAFYAGYTRLKIAKQRVRAGNNSRDFSHATAHPLVQLLDRGAACMDG